MPTGPKDPETPAEVTGNATQIGNAAAGPTNAQKREVPFPVRLKELQQRTKALGTPDPDFDEKAFCDEMWGTGRISEPR